MVNDFGGFYGTTDDFRGDNLMFPKISFSGPIMAEDIAPSVFELSTLPTRSIFSGIINMTRECIAFAGTHLEFINFKIPRVSVNLFLANRAWDKLAVFVWRGIVASKKFVRSPVFIHRINLFSTAASAFHGFNIAGDCKESTTKINPTQTKKGEQYGA